MAGGTRNRAAGALVALGLVTALGYAVLPLSDDARSVITVLVIAGIAAVVLVAARRGWLPRDTVWLLLLAGLFIQLVGQTLWTVTAPDDRTVSTAAWIDVIFLASYLVTAAGLALLIHRRGRDRDVPALLDAAVLTISAGSVIFLLTITPPWGQFGSNAEQAIAAGYVIADLSLLALSCSLLRGSDRRNRSLLLIVGSLLVSFASDAVLDGIVVLNGWHWDSPAPIEGAWLLAYAMMAAAIVHPSATAATAPALAPPVRLSWHGVLILAVAGLLVPLAAVYSKLVQDIDRTIALAVTGSALLVVILARLAVLVLSVQDQAAVFERQARRDPLTGLPNRRTLDLSLARMMRVGASAGQPTDPSDTDPGRSSRLLTVAMVDLDHFKAYNDAHGHAGGDHLLRRAATVWSRVIEDAADQGEPGAPPVLARYGGEEFTLLAPGRSLAQVRELLELMQQATPDGQSFSAGMMGWDGLLSAEELLAGADAAMYAAKVAGRRRIYPRPAAGVRAAGAG